MVNKNTNQSQTIPCSSVIFSSAENAWSDSIKCTFGCGNQVTFNKEIVGKGGEQIPHLTPDKQHYCPIGYRNFCKLDATIQAENRVMDKLEVSQ